MCYKQLFPSRNITLAIGFEMCMDYIMSSNFGRYIKDIYENEIEEKMAHDLEQPFASIPDSMEEDDD